MAGGGHAAGRVQRVVGDVDRGSAGALRILWREVRTEHPWRIRGVVRSDSPCSASAPCKTCAVTGRASLEHRSTAISASWNGVRADRQPTCHCYMTAATAAGRIGSGVIDVATRASSSVQLYILLSPVSLHSSIATAGHRPSPISLHSCIATAGHRLSNRHIRPRLARQTVAAIWLLGICILLAEA